MPRVTSYKENNFNLLRFIFAALVIVSHSFPLTLGHERTEPIKLLTRDQMTLGNLSVYAFFIISGFLISQSWEGRKSILDYLGRRVKRIYPGFIVTVILSAFLVPVLIGRTFETPGWRGIPGFIAQSLRLRFIETDRVFVDNPTPPVNGSLWSIPFEFWCYIGLMALGLVGVLKRRAWLIALFVASVVVSVVFAHWNLKPGGKILGVILGSPRIWAVVAPYFLGGMTLYAFRDRVTVDPRLAAGALVLVVGGALLGSPWLAGIMPLAATYLIFFLAFNPWLKFSNFAKRGDISYGMYLYAFPIEQLTIFYLHGKVGPWMLTAIAFPLACVAGVISWHAVEKWFLPRRRGHTIPKDVPSEPVRVTGVVDSQAVAAPIETRS